MRKATASLILCLAWAVATVSGFVALSSFKNTPGAEGVTPRQWPEDVPFTHDPGRYTLLLFAHPRCPCTRASIEELNRLLAGAGNRIAARVLFLAPSTLPGNWSETASWREADAIPGVSVLADRDGVLGRRFGAESSGFVVLFDSQGRLCFKGGITASRGHAGDNEGVQAILAASREENPAIKQTPVFGCSLMKACEKVVQGPSAWKR